jgi:hypothetical protein
MKKILEDIKTFLAEIVGLIGGLIWAKNTNWDYEPIILISLSLLGIIIFVLIKSIPSNEERPIVEMELISNTSFRKAREIIPNVSPRNENGNYIQETNGLYYYEIEHKFDLIIRNNSIQNAYNIKIFVPKVAFLMFINETNSLEPLTIHNPRTIKMVYRIGKGMTHAEADELLDNKLTEDLKNAHMIIEYQNEQRKTYYSKFTPLSTNVRLGKNPNLDGYKVI